MGFQSHVLPDKVVKMQSLTTKNKNPYHLRLHHFFQESVRRGHFEHPKK